MGVAWCSNCKSDISVDAAISKRPCPKCGCSDYTVFDEPISPISYSDRQAEDCMQNGEWENAMRIYHANGEYAASEMVLRMATLQLRKEGCDFVNSLLSQYEDGLEASAMLSIITELYDQFVATWILEKYNGIKLVRNGNATNVILNEME